MGRSCFSYPNWWDGGAITASSADPNHPATNTQRQALSTRWRSGTLDSSAQEYLDCDLGQARLVKALHVVGGNFSDEATVTLEADIGGSGYWSQTVAADPDITTLYVPSITEQVWRLTFYDPANADGYIQVPRVVLAGTFSPARNFLRKPPQLVMPSLVTKTLGGQKRGVIRSQYWQRGFVWPMSNEKALFDAMVADIDLLKTVIFCEDVAAPTAQNTYYATVAEYATDPAVYGWWDISMVLEDEL